MEGVRSLDSSRKKRQSVGPGGKELGKLWVGERMQRDKGERKTTSSDAFKSSRARTDGGEEE